MYLIACYTLSTAKGSVNGVFSRGSAAWARVYLHDGVGTAHPAINALFDFLFSYKAIVEATFGGAVAAAGEFEDVAGSLDVVGPVELESEFRAGQSYQLFGQAEFHFIAADGIAYGCLILPESVRPGGLQGG